MNIKKQTAEVEAARARRTFPSPLPVLACLRCFSSLERTNCPEYKLLDSNQENSLRTASPLGQSGENSHLVHFHVARVTSDAVAPTC